MALATETMTGEGVDILTGGTAPDEPALASGNDPAPTVVSPRPRFGGVLGSGCGREMGFEAMRECTTPTSVWIDVDADLPPWYPR